MTRFAALALVAAVLATAPAAAQYVIVQSPPAICNPAPVYSAPVYSAPVTTYSSPVVAYSAPAVLRPTPVVNYSYYAPTYYPPTTSYYSAPVYSAPVYSSPVLVPAGTVTTRSYFGLGIFRPFGWNTESYYSYR